MIRSPLHPQRRRQPLQQEKMPIAPSTMIQAHPNVGCICMPYLGRMGPMLHNEAVPKYVGSNDGAKTKTWQYSGHDPNPNYWVFHDRYLHRNRTLLSTK
eukprot:scaffold27062_cov139-Skeletonema_menzelii.AAC.8